MLILINAAAAAFGIASGGSHSGTSKHMNECMLPLVIPWVKKLIYNSRLLYPFLLSVKKTKHEFVACLRMLESV